MKTGTLFQLYNYPFIASIRYTNIENQMLKNEKKEQKYG